MESASSFHGCPAWDLTCAHWTDILPDRHAGRWTSAYAVPTVASSAKVESGWKVTDTHCGAS
eukprot:15420368-Alexandrium_andersonii.AAC.1